MRRRPWLAAAALVASLAGGGAVIAAVAALPDPWIGGYVSQAGAVAAPHAGLYRFGMVALCAGLILLGLAVPTPVGPALSTTVLLIAAGASGAVSAAVPCSPGCPLPPYQRPTGADLVHAGAGTLAVALIYLAVWSTATAVADHRGRRLAWVWLVVAGGALLTFVIGLLATRHGLVTAVAERVALVLLFSWVVANAAYSSLPRTSRDRISRDRTSRDRLSRAGSPPPS
jgi:hypothetical protein